MRLIVIISFLILMFRHPERSEGSPSQFQMLRYARQWAHTVQHKDIVFV
jgi:hypothetical protein